MRYAGMAGEGSSPAMLEVPARWGPALPALAGGRARAPPGGPGRAPESRERPTAGTEQEAEGPPPPPGPLAFNRTDRVNVSFVDEECAF